MRGSKLDALALGTTLRVLEFWVSTLAFIACQKSPRTPTVTSTGTPVKRYVPWPNTPWNRCSPLVTNVVGFAVALA